MLYIDGLSLNIIKEELKENLLNKKINRVFKNNDYSLSLHFGKKELLFSCMPNLSVCYINQNKEKPILDIASSIISNLRKYLMNAMLVNIEQLGFDRILVFHFTKITELGEVKKYYIYFECLSKTANLIFCDEEHKVIDSLKKFYISQSTDRTLFYGEPYKRPKHNNKISPLELNEEDFNKYKLNKSLCEKIEGLGKISEDSINNFLEYKNLINNKKFVIYLKNKKIKLATVLDLKLNDKSYDEVKIFNNFEDLINFYINYETKSTSFILLKNKLLNSVDKKIKKLKKTLDLIKKDIENSGIMSDIKEEADILASILYSVKKGMKDIKTFNFYKNNEILINLDPLLNPKENLDRKYRKYNKIKRGVENALRREKEVEEELEYLDSILLFIENTDLLENLREIEEELILSKYLLASHQTKKTKLKKEIKYGILEFKDALILYGRNNIENDNLTFKVANKNDFWFHAKNIPSSHIIVKTNDLSTEIIEKAAEIIAFFTKLKVDEKIEVDYTQRKYLNKPSGAKPGFVTYTNQKTILVKKREIKL